MSNTEKDENFYLKVSTDEEEVVQVSEEEVEQSVILDEIEEIEETEHSRDIKVEVERDRLLDRNSDNQRNMDYEAQKLTGLMKLQRMAKDNNQKRQEFYKENNLSDNSFIDNNLIDNTLIDRNNFDKIKNLVRFREEGKNKLAKFYKGTNNIQNDRTMNYQDSFENPNRI